MKLPAAAGKSALPEKPLHDAFSGHGHTCLNCGHAISGNFCSNCGQSAHTHRLSIKHFLLHDLVHSFWHVDRGIFLTLKEVVIRPGYAALEYIHGKRAGRFPILTLLILLIGISLWLSSLMHPHEQSPVTISGDAGKVATWLYEFIQHNQKWILLGQLPIGALSTWIVFRKVRLNYTEHLFVNSYVFGGVLFVQLVLNLIGLALPAIASFLDRYSFSVGLLFYGFGYWQAFHRSYSIKGLLLRFPLLMLVDVLLLILVIGALFAIAAVMVGNGTA